MSKKTGWRWISSSDEYKLLSPEERVAYRKEKEKERKKAFKVYDKIKRMPIEKPKFNKPSSHKNTKERGEELEED